MNENICPQCKRQLTGSQKFCPFCGADLRGESASPPQVAPPSPARPQPTLSQPPQVRLRSVPAGRQPGFRWFDRRVFAGLLSLVLLPVVIILLGLLLLPRLRATPVTLSCEDINPAEFTPTRLERGLTGELENDTIFAQGDEYIIQGTLTVPANRRLLIQPGVLVEFEADAALEIRGSVYVCGTDREPVTFTGVDAEPGSWQGVKFIDAKNDSALSHLLIQFADRAGVWLEDSTPTLQNIKIANSSGFPISSDGSKMPTLLDHVEFERNGFDGIEIRGGSLANRQQIEWPAQGVVYIVSGPVVVGENTALKIGADAVVKFWFSGGRVPGLEIRGLLQADQVIFTSVYDDGDEVGGATFVEARDPEAGDWAGLWFRESSSQSQLSQVEVRYAGAGQAAVAMQASSPELVDVVIRNSAWYPLSADALAFPELSSITLVDNDPGDAMEVVGNLTLNGRQQYRWSRLGDEEEIVRVVRANLTIAPETTLIVDPGVTVKFETAGGLTVDGTLQANGGLTEDEQIVFTSLRDDEYGGQTDINSGPQDERQWQGITFRQSDSSSHLERVLIRFGSVHLQSAAPRLYEIVIRDSSQAALNGTPDASPDLRGVVMQDNAINGLGIYGGRVTGEVRWAYLGESDEQIIRVLLGNLTVESEAVLQIQPGIIIKLAPDVLILVQGDVVAVGSDEANIVLTSLQDDVGGDTNQAIMEARAGDWRGVEIRDGARLTLNNVALHFAETALWLKGIPELNVSGVLWLADGEQAVRCEQPLELPPGIVTNNNVLDAVDCGGS